MKEYFQQAERKARRKALWVTIVFHILFLGGLLYSTQSEKGLDALMPEFVKEWIDQIDSNERGSKERA